MKLLCPHCGVKGSADDSYQGRAVKCPKCGGIFSAVLETAVPPQDDLNPVLPVAVEAQDELALLGGLDDIPDNAAEMKDEPLVPADDDLFDTSDLGVEDITEALTLTDAPDEEHIVTKGNTDLEADHDEIFVWSDIASEIDREMDEDTRREKEGQSAPAALHDFFEDTAPAEEGFEMPAGEVQGEISIEEVALADNASESPEADIEKLFGDESEEPAQEKDATIEVEHHPDGMEKEQCWQCGKKDSVGVPFIAKDGRLYCPDCLPDEDPDHNAATDTSASLMMENGDVTDAAPQELRPGFTIGGLVKEAWVKTQGAKAAVWGGTAVMYLALLILFAGAAILLPSEEKIMGAPSLTGVLANALSSFVVNAVSMIFTAGLLLIGIRKVAGESVNWKMVLEGFSVTGKIVIVTFLQTILICIGFLLLILPGIYLAIGYSMTLPLIIDRKMSPWQAMEVSRKAIHVVWWKIFGLFIIMSLIFMISALPLGLGIIWTWPMCVVLGGVVYRSLFRIEKKQGENSE